MKFERLKATFTFNDLKDSTKYYLPILKRFDDLTDKDYSVIFDTIIIYNRSFVKLLANAELYTAFAIIRLQIDNLICLYADYKYPEERVLCAVFNGKEFGKIEINGNPLKYLRLREQLDEEYGTTIRKIFSDTNIRELYKKYCGYVHLSKLQAEIPDDFYVDSKGNTFFLVAQQRKYAKDMIAINQLIGKLVKDILKYESGHNKKSNTNPDTKVDAASKPHL